MVQVHVCDPSCDASHYLYMLMQLQNNECLLVLGYSSDIVTVTVTIEFMEERFGGFVGRPRDCCSW
jgi:hypothetical protein